MRSALYGVNTNSQTVPVNSSINFGNIIRRFGCNIALNNGSVILTGAGYYDINVNVTLSTAIADEVTVTLYKDGVAIPGATATVTNTAGGLVAVSIPTIVRQMCNVPSVITAVVTGLEATVNNAAIVAEKI